MVAESAADGWAESGGNVNTAIWKTLSGTYATSGGNRAEGAIGRFGWRAIRGILCWVGVVSVLGFGGMAAATP